MSSELRFDVLVLGGGGAALRAALSACEQGAKTAILSKGEAGKSGATYYSVAEVGAFNVPDGALDPEDSPEEFYRDMEMAALGTAQLPLCRILAEQAESALQYLEKISGGTVFAKEDGHFKVYQGLLFHPASLPCGGKPLQAHPSGPPGGGGQKGHHGSQRSAGGGSAERGRTGLRCVRTG